MGIVNIVIADDHKIVRQGTRALLESEPGFTVVGEACDGVEALATVSSTKPDVLVTDLMMPRLNGIQLTRQAIVVSPRTMVIVLSMYDNEAYVLEALRNGAKGYVLKDAGLDELATAIREAVAGRVYLSPPLSEGRVAAFRQKLEAELHR